MNRKIVCVKQYHQLPIFRLIILAAALNLARRPRRKLSLKCTWSSNRRWLMWAIFFVTVVDDLSWALNFFFNRSSWNIHSPLKLFLFYYYIPCDWTCDRMLTIKAQLLMIPKVFLPSNLPSSLRSELSAILTDLQVIINLICVFQFMFISNRDFLYKSVLSNSISGSRFQAPMRLPMSSLNRPLRW